MSTVLNFLRWEHVDAISIALLIAAFLVYLIMCGLQRAPLDLIHLFRILPFAALPNIVAFLYGAIDPTFLTDSCDVRPECLSWSVRITLALGGMLALALFAQGVGLIRLQSAKSTQQESSRLVL